MSILQSHLSQVPCFEEFEFNDWQFEAVYSKSILPSVDPCLAPGGVKRDDCDFCHFQKNLNELPQLPEMIFPRNKLVVKHTKSGAFVEFNSLDALKFVDTKNDWVKVHSTQEWSEARKDCEFIKNAVKTYDWTYTTNYKGNCSNFKNIETTEERINLQKLMTQEKILFYQALTLYEDELADNGCSQLVLKFRCMPSCFFALLRFYLRVDNVLVKINDTRLFWEIGKPYVLREYCSKEKRVDQMTPTECLSCLDANEIAKSLNVIEERFEKLIFE